MLNKFKFLLVFVLFLPLAATINMPVKKAGDIPANGGKIAKYHPDRVIVRFKAGISEEAITAVHKKIGTKQILASHMIPGLQLVKIPDNLNAEKTVKLFKNEGMVKYAELDIAGHLNQTYPDDPGFVDQWGFDQQSDVDIDAPEAWDNATGSTSPIIVVQDTGVDYNHEDLASNMWTNANEIVNGLDDDSNGIPDDLHGFNAIATGGDGTGCGGNSNLGDPMDGYGHGTHVSGTIAARGNNAKGVAGVNWRAKIMACKWIDAYGAGWASDAIKCFEYTWWQKVYAGQNIVATSNSWGLNGPSAAVYEAIKAHRDAGILAIFSAGNDGFDTDTAPQYPAAYNLENIISVGGIDATGANIYNYGRKTVDVHAPADMILSTCSYTQYNCIVTPDYPYDGGWSGTSMAAPHVTGLAALLKAQDPTRDWKAIKNLILAGAEQIDPLSDLSVTEGLLNMNNSVTCTDRKVYALLEPIPNPASGYVNAPLKIAVLNIDCAMGAGAVTVNVYDGENNLIDTFDLLDDGVFPDAAAGDGIYTGNLVTTVGDNYSLQIVNQDSVTITTGATIADHYAVYNNVPEIFDWRDISETGTALNIGDENIVEVTAPFPLSFYGATYNSVWVGDNGALDFDGVLPGYGTIDCLPNTAVNTLIAPWYDDLWAAPNITGDAYYATLTPGPSGDNEFVVSYIDVERYGGSTPISFQVIFFQNSPDIVFQYLTTVTDDGCDGAACGAVGLQANTTTANQYSCFEYLVYDDLAMRWQVVQDVGNLAVDPVDLNYGFVTDSLVRTTLLTNVGNQPLDIENIIGPTLPEFTILNAPTLPLTLNPGDQYTLQIEFHTDADAMVQYFDNIEIQWSTVGPTKAPKKGFFDGTAYVNLTAWGVSGPDIDVEAAFSFGQTVKCECKQVDIEVFNVGHADLIISDLEMQGANFFVVGATLPMIIAPDASDMITVEYCAAGAGTELGKLLINSNDPDEPLGQILLTGLAPVLEPTATCAHIFSDVPASNPFCTYIEGLYKAGVVTGCSTIPEYCPSAGVPRDQMAKYIALSTCPTVAACVGNVFTDVGPTNIFCPYIEAIANAGIVNGCTATQYCPSNVVNRDQMTKFICNGMNFVNPGSCTIAATCTGVFTDVPSSNIFCRYIERLYALNIIGGCGPSLYCPSAVTTRQVMAKFIINAFD